MIEMENLDKSEGLDDLLESCRKQTERTKEIIKKANELIKSLDMEISLAKAQSKYIDELYKKIVNDNNS